MLMRAIRMGAIEQVTDDKVLIRIQRMISDEEDLWILDEVDKFEEERKRKSNQRKRIKIEPPP